MTAPHIISFRIETRRFHELRVDLSNDDHFAWEIPAPDDAEKLADFLIAAGTHLKQHLYRINPKNDLNSGDMLAGGSPWK